MIRLHPVPDAHHECPHCQVSLEVREWYIPGMRNLADLVCPKCHREFYGDLAAGQALYSPMLLQIDNGSVYDGYGVAWFSNWLRDSYARRTSEPLGFQIEENEPVERPVLLNCLDMVYGHSLLKLLNAQYYLDHRSDLQLIVMVPRFLRWLVPEGVAAIWTVDLPLRQGIDWNDWFAAELHKLVDGLDECWLSVALSHPHPEDYDIERFTRVRPFPVDEWAARMERPTVTFIWREDRTWGGKPQGKRWQSLIRRMNRALGLPDPRVVGQKRTVIKLARALRRAVPQIDFAVAGLGQPGGLPDWIADLRTQQIDERVETAWCQRYARSHVVIGVYGSNMLLPSAHAGSVVELMPGDRWGGVLQDLLLSARDVREAVYRYRFLPLDAPPATVAEVTFFLLRRLPNALLTFERPWCDHEALARDPGIVAMRRREIEEKLEHFRIHPFSM